MGELERGYYSANQWEASTLISHRWDESIRTQLGATFYKGSSLKVNIGAEYDYDFFTIIPTSVANDQAIPANLYYGDLKIHRADIEYDVVSSGNFGLMLQLGYFPFKYNPQSANLGEYLFRSECYPNFLVNEFDWSEARLLGVNLESSLQGTIAGLDIPYRLRQNLMMLSETTYPTQDVSLAYLANADFWNDAFELGAGIDAARILPVDPQRTTPQNIDNSDTIISATHDTSHSYYTFAGIKTIARMCFDVKKVVPMSFLGVGRPQDL